MTHDSRVIKESSSLASAGYDVHVAALSGEGLLKEEQRNGFTIHRIPLWTRKFKHIVIFRPFIYFEFLIRMTFRFKTSDVIHIHSIEPLLLGVILKGRSFGKSWLIYDAHEYESEKNGLSGWMKTSIKWIERICIRFVDGFITVSQSILNDYKKMYSIDIAVLIHNCPPSRVVERTDRLRTSLNIEDDTMIFIYQGGLSRGRGIDQLIEAFSSGPTPGRCLVMMGYGVLQAEVEKAANENDNIYFHEAVAPEVLLEYTASADVGIALIEPICLSYEYCLPNKMFEYAMVALPLLVSPLVEMKQKVENGGLGWVLADHSSISLREKVLEIEKSSLPGYGPALAKFSQTYNWQKEQSTLLDLYEQVLRNR